jgi:hypothetical protein
MARITVGDSVGANQREAVLMLVDIVKRNFPAADAMTESALRTIPPPMNVGVTILAITANVGENRTGMAFLALHRGVQPAQGKSGLVMLELRLATNWSP